MSIQRLSAFEKTSIQARHSIKRLEMYIETERLDGNKAIAQRILDLFKEIRKEIPDYAQDVDLLKEKE